MRISVQYIMPYDLLGWVAMLYQKANRDTLQYDKPLPQYILQNVLVSCSHHFYLNIDMQV